MQIAVVPVTPFQQNCSVVWDERSKRAAIVDPGGDLDQVLAVVRDEGLTVEKILLTHAHLDHAAGTAELARRCGGLPVEGPHRGDRFWIERLPEQALMFGFPPAEVFTPTRWLEQGDTVTVGDVTMQVRHCPGHTPGHVVFFHEPGRFAIVGDVLFAGSIGRTDFPGGNHEQLLRSIRENLFPLGDDVRFLPGHGPMSTFGAERRSNPFVADALFRGRG
ncbi:MAG: MBL fold metallo-hydrolase [Steroidobacteraceae bacterium]|nr:MBL fold metallo-hydrolase [Steroidobacteraceae bacterium]MDW8259966.1 MBL fold metallo-hydrolase [Gammaproteobacteria bacterium]